MNELRELLPAGYKLGSGKVIDEASREHYNRVQTEINEHVKAGREVPGNLLMLSFNIFNHATIISNSK